LTTSATPRLIPTGRPAAAGCAVTPQPGAPTSGTATDQGACLSYGYQPGTTAYIACARREAEARRTGKLGTTYDQILITPQQQQ
jgi:hypothetical protein